MENPNYKGKFENTVAVSEALTEFKGIVNGQKVC